MSTATVHVPEPNPEKALEIKSTDDVSPPQAPVRVSEVKDAANSEPVNDVKKKIKRAERFGMPLQLSEEEKRSSRAERLGSAAISNETDAVKGSDEQKKKVRAERFGLPTETVSDEEAKKKARLARFSATSKTDNVEDDKRKARALRFSQPSVAAVLNVSDEGKLVHSATVAVKAGGAA